MTTNRKKQIRFLFLLVIVALLIAFAGLYLNEKVITTIGVISAIILTLCTIPGIEARLPKRITLEELDQQNREQILASFYKSWIEGVLHKNTEAGEFYVDYELQANAIDTSYQYDNFYHIPQDIRQALREIGEQLLILGKPGAGKSILLLQLAEILYEEAKNNYKSQMPLIFNLSSWLGKREKLEDWLIDEIDRNYKIDKKIAKDWLNRNKFVLLLDGLDEVSQKYRDECIEAINDYNKSMKNLRLIISSRVEDYAILRTKLNLKGAIFLKDLTDSKINSYLSGEKNEGVRQLIKNEPIAKDLAKEPFFLNIMKLIYEGRPYKGSPHFQLKNENPKEQLLKEYVYDRLKNEDIKKISHYLAWISHKITKNDLDRFYIEELQSSDLNQSNQNLYIWFMIAIFAIIFIAGSMFISKWTIVEIIGYGVLGGSMGLASGKKSIKVFDKLTWSFKKGYIKHSLSGGIFVANQMAPIMGILFVLLSISIDSLFESNINFVNWLFSGIALVCIMWLIICLIFTVIIGFIISLDTKIYRETRFKPNQGIKQSFIYGLIMEFLFGLFFGLIYLLVIRHINGLIVGFILGLYFALLSDGYTRLVSGLNTFIQHITLRFILWRAKLAPLNYAKFLIHCSELGLLRQVGGGFIFRHRYLQEYFAQEWEKSHPSTE
ncbi:MAG: NACHT domain-containing protein [bacterium]|nr:NACHT domain-containing protein [bacterium]